MKISLYYAYYQTNILILPKIEQIIKPNFLLSINIGFSYWVFADFAY